MQLQRRVSPHLPINGRLQHQHPIGRYGPVEEEAGAWRCRFYSGLYMGFEMCFWRSWEVTAWSKFKPMDARSYEEERNA